MADWNIFRRLRSEYRDTTGVQNSGPVSFGGVTGVTIGDQKAMQISAFWACVRLISEIIGTLPINVYEKTDAGRSEAKDHPLYRVLHRKPNRYQTAIEFKETMVLNLAMTGNAYAVIQREEPNNLDSPVVGLLPMYSQSMEVVLDKEGRVTYEYTTEKSTQVYSSDSILHVRLFGPSPVIGLSPIKHMGTALGVAASIESHQGRFFKNGARPGGVLKVDKFLSTEERQALQERFGNAYTGDDNAFKLFLLEGGLEYSPITINPEDAQMLESAAFSVEEICRFFRVPPQLVGQTDKASSWASSLENLNMYFLQYSIEPYLARIEQAINEKLFPTEERGRFYAEFKADALLRTDATTRQQVYSGAIQNGWMTRNEVRRLENLPPKEGGDVLTMQVNQMGINDAEQTPNA